MALHDPSALLWVSLVIYVTFFLFRPCPKPYDDPTSCADGGYFPYI